MIESHLHYSFWIKVLIPKIGRIVVNLGDA
jgi:hypothetical protein